MSYDLYVNYPCNHKDDVYKIVNNPDLVIPIRIALLAGALGKYSRVKEHARTGTHKQGGYKSLIFATNPVKSPYTREVIVKEKQRMERLGLWKPAVPDFAALPSYSAFFHFQFTLATPYISRDDEIFHICDNPVRKDKVFKVPSVAGGSWKGNLGWTAKRLLVLRWEEDHDPKELAEGRLRLSLLFGNEKDEQYLDRLEPADKAQEAAHLFRAMLKERFDYYSEEIKSYAGCLYFYPTFFDRIGLELINPHERITRAGKRPIYIECVPPGATGYFSLLYAPHVDISEDTAREDLALIAESLRELMLRYGFAAKKSSGFGEAEDEIKEGKIVTNGGQWQVSRLSSLAGEVCHVRWS
ncbi:MAG TPA: hypothetical protein GXZ26_10060 [Firmicutes bacterium]|nr:hypothetical protein [Bacillota bacterium]